jgi:hypothetical protein
VQVIFNNSAIAAHSTKALAAVAFEPPLKGIELRQAQNMGVATPSCKVTYANSIDDGTTIRTGYSRGKNQFPPLAGSPTKTSIRLSDVADHIKFQGVNT